jgi:hypothetical protein
MQYNVDYIVILLFKGFEAILEKRRKTDRRNWEQDAGEQETVHPTPPI